MFYFGDSELVARMYLDSLSTRVGPGYINTPVEELPLDEARIVMAYLYGAVRQASEDGAEEPVLEKLIEWYDSSFVAVAAASEAFVERVRIGRVLPPHGVTHRAKYLELAGLLRNPSDS